MKLMASASTNWAGQRQVALVLAVLVVDDDDEAAVPILLDCLLDRRQRRIPLLCQPFAPAAPNHRSARAASNCST